VLLYHTPFPHRSSQLDAELRICAVLNFSSSMLKCDQVIRAFESHHNESHHK